MRFTSASLSLSLGLVASLGVGCGQIEPGDTSNESGSPPAESSAGTTFSRTVVVLGPNGQQQVTVEAVTAAEIERMKEERAHPAAKRDDVAYTLLTADCSNGNSMWLFDQANLTGNMLCLIRNGAESLSWANLSAFQRANRLSPNWSKAVRSFWAGNEIGFFHAANSAAEVFGVFQQVNAVSTTVQGATVMGIASGAVRAATFSGWSLRQSSCARGTVSVTDRTTGTSFIQSITPSSVRRFDGLLDCRFDIPFNTIYGHLYDTGFGTCGATPIESGMAVPPSSLSSGVVHFFNGGCSVSEPIH
jgi:hypothetical protein